MPSNFRVALSLDKEANDIWNQLPAGDKSRRVREALKTALIVYEKDLKADAQSELINSLRTDRKQLQRALDQARHFKCGHCRCTCVIEYIDKDGVRVYGKVVEE